MPDIIRSETKLWLLYLAGTYISTGCEAIHFGQIDLMGMNDQNYTHWAILLSCLRKYSATHALRHWILCDAHTPHGDMVVNGKSLLDFNAFPLRIKKVIKGDLAFGREKHIDLQWQIGYHQQENNTPAKWLPATVPGAVQLDVMKGEHYKQPYW